jgi:hypothetical protein
MDGREELIREGWEKKFTAYGHRLKESKEFFEELGFEVRLEPAEAPADVPDESCRTCLSEFERTIYIRKLSGEEN